ncbi:MAG: L,D-transpeptidase [Frankiaceae bacterium]|nr:L,D-transpeptidase [Frankiaceae bacterium]MBV9368699.1 L,D-transpeptidase [Frankiales bacterium]
MCDPTATPEHRSLASRSRLLLVILCLATGCATPAPSASRSASSGWQLSRGESLIAFAKASRIVVRSRWGGPARWRLANPNASGAPLVFLVVAAKGDGWAVRVPARPNGAVGWVRGRDVRLEIDPYAMRASLKRRTLAVYDEGRRVRVFRIGIGRPGAPTPTGSFFVTELLEPVNPNGPYGPYAYGTSAFSTVYSEFEGGPGQIGVHGTGDRSSIGRNVSHGCLRLAIRDISWMAHNVPAGTPLTIGP